MPREGRFNAAWDARAAHCPRPRDDWSPPAGNPLIAVGDVVELRQQLVHRAAHRDMAQLVALLAQRVDLVDEQHTRRAAAASFQYLDLARSLENTNG